MNSEESSKSEGSLFEEKRRQFIEALERGEIGEPVSLTVFTSVLLGAALSAVSSLVVRAVTPRQKFTTGQITGALYIPEWHE